MNANESRSRGLLRLKHAREVNEAKAEEMAELAPRFARLADPASACRAVVVHQLFQTPEPLAARIASMFPAFGRTLEPSAGLGRLYRASRAMGTHHITLVECAADCCRELYRETEADQNCRLIQADFLTCDVERIGMFDTIIANPPFTNRGDIKHIRHSLEFLKPNGMLVAICAAGPRQRKEFADADEWIDLPSNSFKESGTGVNAAIVVYRK